MRGRTNRPHDQRQHSNDANATDARNDRVRR